MKTIEEIKAEILASKPSRIYTLNGEQYEQTDAEFADAVQKKAEMVFEQNQIEAAKIALKASAEAKLAALGLTADDLKALGI